MKRLCILLACAAMLSLAGCCLSISKGAWRELSIANRSGSDVSAFELDGKEHLIANNAENERLVFDGDSVIIKFQNGDVLKYAVSSDVFPEVSQSIRQPWFEAAYYIMSHAQLGEDRKLYAIDIENRLLSPQPEGFPITGVPGSGSK